MAGRELAHPGGPGTGHGSGHPAAGHNASEHHASEHHGSEHHDAEHHEPVVAPDQLKPPPFRRLWIFGGVVTVIALVLMAFVGNHHGNVEKVFLVGIAALIVIGGITAFFLKRLGLRN